MKLTALIALSATIQLAHAQQKLNDRFVLDGKIENQRDGLVYLSYMNKNGERVRDSAALKNGSFQFRGAINEPTIATFWGNITSRSVDDPNYTTLFLEPGNMKLAASEGHFKTAMVTGSKTQSEYAVIQSKLEKIRERWKVVMDTLSAANKRSNFEYQALRSWALKPYFAEVRELDLDFFDKHRTSYVTAYRLRFMLTELTTDSIKLFYGRFPQKLKESEYGKYIASALEKRKLGVVGSMANNFTTTDINNNQISLADLKGKYVLLDFWASWCLPCRKLNPHLKELYAKYKDRGFEVVGVSDDDRNPDAWRKAVVEDALPWKHVLRGARQSEGRVDSSKDISAGFNISSLPTHVLIDPTGKIIGRYGEEDGHDELDKKLETIFSK